MRLLVAGLCLLLSGFSGLVYEIAWIREASLVFGSATHAVSTVVAVFFGGLALGSWLAGRRPVARPMRAYVLLELGLAVVAVISPALFAAANLAFGAVYDRVGPLGLGLARVGLVALILLPPATLMGATLPLFCRQLVIDARRIGTTVAALYALNTLGATLGCLVAGFVLLPAVGITGSIRLAAIGNVLAALLAHRMRWDELDEPSPRAKAAEPRSWLPALLMFGAGFAIVGDEVLWTRYLALLVHHDVYTYTITLGTILLGIVLGAALAARVSDRPNTAYAVFGALQIGVGLYVMLLTSAPPSFWTDLSGGWLAHGLLLLPPSILSGASFPVAVRMVVREPGQAASGVGRMAALNTVGGIAGSLLAGFVFLPSWGLQRSLHLFTAVSLLGGLAAWLVPALDRQLMRRTALAAVAVFAWGLTPALAGTRVPQDFLAAPGALIDFREGRAANVAVVKVRDHRELTIDRLWQGQDEKNHQIMAAHLPMLLHPAPADVLVIGVGAGLAPSRFLMHPPLARLDCVDIEPAVFGLIEAHFDSAWMSDPRVRLIGDDGRNHVRHGRQTYDLISVEVGQTIRPGVGGFYTVDFYREARARLKPGGVVSQFLPLLYFPIASFRRALRSFREVFPTAVLFYNKTELLLVGFDGDTVPPLQLDRLATPALARDLHFSPWGGPAVYLHQPDALAAGLLLGPEGVAAVAGEAEPFADDRPELDYLASELGPGVVLERAVIAALLPHIAPPTALGYAPADPQRFALIREGNLRDLKIADELRSVDLAGPPEPTLKLLGEALAVHPDSLEVHLLLGEVHLRRGDAPRAAKHFGQALRIEPAAHAAARGLAFALHRLSRPAEAIPLYRRALARRPDDATTHNNLGVALAGEGHLTEAREHFRAALALDPSYEEAARNLALAEQGPR